MPVRPPIQAGLLAPERHRQLHAPRQSRRDEELTRRGITPDLEASHPKIGLLVREAAASAPAILQFKRG